MADNFPGLMRNNYPWVQEAHKILNSISKKKYLHSLHQKIQKKEVSQVGKKKIFKAAWGKRHIIRFKYWKLITSSHNSITFKSLSKMRIKYSHSQKNKTRRVYLQQMLIIRTSKSCNSGRIHIPKGKSEMQEQESNKQRNVATSK